MVHRNVLFILDFLELVLLASHLQIMLPPRCTVVFMLLKVRSIFATKTAFNSIHKDVLPIFNKSLLIYKFRCWCNSTYIDRTSQCLEVRVRQYVPRGILNSGQVTCGHSWALNSAIGEHLLSTNSCRTNYQDDWFSLLLRARSKIHLNILKAICIFVDRPSLNRQRTNHDLQF